MDSHREESGGAVASCSGAGCALNWRLPLIHKLFHGPTDGDITMFLSCAQSLSKVLVTVMTLALVMSPTFAASLGKDYDHQITDLTKRSKCEDAERLVNEARNKDEVRAELPRWYYQLIECAGGDFGAYGMSIIEFYDREVRKFTDLKACKKAEQYVKGIDEKYKRLQSLAGHARWSLAVARCFESVHREKSVELYRDIITKFSDSDIARSAKGRLRFLQGDRSWIFARFDTVRDGVIDALRTRDLNRLGQFASQSSFSFGYEEDFRIIEFKSDLIPVLEKALKKSTARYFAKRDTGTTKKNLMVEFREEEFPCWLFNFENIDGGWQWTGVTVSNLVTRANANWSQEFVCDHPALH